MWYNIKTKKKHEFGLNFSYANWDEPPVDPKYLFKGDKVKIKTSTLPEKFTNRCGGVLFRKLKEKVEGVIDMVHYEFKSSGGKIRADKNKVNFYEVKIILSENTNGEVYTIKSVTPEEIVEIWIE